MSVFDRLAKESEAERQEWARRNAQTSMESTARVNQDLGRGSSLFDRLEKVYTPIRTKVLPFAVFIALNVVCLIVPLGSPDAQVGVRS